MTDFCETCGKKLDKKKGQKKFCCKECFYKSRIKNITGQKFGKLTAIKRIGANKHGDGQWLCKCDCGNEVTVTITTLLNGTTRSCGCIKVERLKANPIYKTHGLSKTKLWVIWKGMKNRCSNKQNKTYYGKGIIVCDEWKEDFMNFYNWAVNNGYKEDLTIDRIDNNKGYSPDNCRWATIKEQSRNRRTNYLITYKDKTHCLAEWAEITNINARVLQNRLRKQHWSIEKALTTPVRHKKGRSNRPLQEEG